MSAHKITVCDVCDQEIREDNGVRKVRYRWFDWGFMRTRERIEDVCSSCWSEMTSYALAKRQEATMPPSVCPCGVHGDPDGDCGERCA